MTTQADTTPAAVTTRRDNAGRDNNQQAGAELFIAFGDRPAVNCARCGTRLPEIQPGHDRFELEDADGGVYCSLDADRQARHLRVAVLLMNEVVDLQRAGREPEARDALQAIVSAMEMIDEARPRPRHQSPVRRQPNRATRRRRR